MHPPHCSRHAAAATWSRWMRAAAAVLLALVALMGATSVHATVWPGGSGKGLYFSRERCDILGVSWQLGSMPTTTVTIEFWALIKDSMNKDHSILGYCEFDGSRSPVYDNPDGIQLRFSGSRTRAYRGEGQSCSSAGCAQFNKGWFHYAVTFDSATGVAQQYFNGVLEKQGVPSPLGQFASALTQGGSMLFGQEPDSYAGLFDETQAFDGMIDEFRVWSVVRSQADIAATMNRELSLAERSHADLELYYDFNGISSGLVPDVSGHSQTGLMGAFVNAVQWCTYSSSRSARLPQQPQNIYTSSLPIGGLSTLDVWIAPTLSSLTATVKVQARSDAGAPVFSYTVTSMLPTFLGGTLALVDATPVVQNVAVFESTLVYTYPGGLLPAVWANLAVVDSFVLSVFDGSTSAATTVNLRFPALPVGHNLSYTTSVGSPFVVNLHTVLEDGFTPVVVLSSLPVPWPENAAVSQQACYSVRFSGTKNETTATYSDILLSTASRTPLALNDPVPHARLLFGPPVISGLNPSAVFVRFGYRYQHPLSLQLSEEKFVTVRVKPVNMAPAVGAGVAPSLQIDLETAAVSPVTAAKYAVATLVATDSDASFSNLVLHRITSLPKLGSLYQVDPTTGVLLDAVSAMDVAQTSLPVVSSWATQVMNASSSYNGVCGACRHFLQCDWSTCSDRSYTAWKILGPNDCYPAFGDCVGNAEPVSKNTGSDGNGGEWIEFRIGTVPLYVSLVEIFETQSPGMVTKISVAAQWTGSSTTNWRTIWSGAPDIFLPAVSRVFSPAVCNLADVAASFVRIEYRIDVFIGAWTGLDAVRVSGTLVPPPGRLTDPSSRVAYVPFAGIFAARNNASAPFDSFTYRPNDCVKEASTDTTVQIYLSGSAGQVLSNGGVTAPASIAALRATSPFATHTRSVSVESESVFAVDVSDLLASYNAAFPLAPATVADVVLTLVDVAPSGALNSADSPALLVQQVSDADGSLGAVLCSSTQSAGGAGCGVAAAVTSSSLRIAVRALRASTAASSGAYTLAFYASVGSDYSYLYKLQVSALQPETYYVWTSSDNAGYTTGISVLAALVLLYVLVVSGFVWRLRGHEVFRAASPGFCAFILVGCMMGTVWAMISAMYEPSKGSCVAEIWVGHLAYALVYGVLFAKSWRVNKIFTQQQIRLVKITNRDLAHRVSVGLLVTMLYLVLWSAIEPPTPAPLLLGNTLYSACSSGDSKVWSNLIIACEGAFLAYGVLLCIQQRSFPDLFNDSQSVAAVLYNTAVLGGLAIGITKSSMLQSGPAIAVFQQLAVLLCIVVLVTVLFMGKFLIIRSRKGKGSMGEAATTQLGTQYAGKDVNRTRLEDENSDGTALSHPGHVQMGTISSPHATNGTTQNVSHGKDGAGQNKSQAGSSNNKQLRGNGANRAANRGSGNAAGVNQSWMDQSANQSAQGGGSAPRSNVGSLGSPVAPVRVHLGLPVSPSLQAAGEGQLISPLSVPAGRYVPSQDGSSSPNQMVIPSAVQTETAPLIAADNLDGASGSGGDAPQERAEIPGGVPEILPQLPDAQAAESS